MRGGPVVTFATEADLCAAFISTVPKDWTVYPETAGFDMVLVHDATGFQIAVEAKLKLNTKVLCQVTEEHRFQRSYGADCLAVLVDGVVAECGALAARMGVTVLRVYARKRYVQRTSNRGAAWESEPPLPDAKLIEPGTGATAWTWDRGRWFDRWVNARLSLPEYVPEVVAGRPAPVILSGWKIAAMRFCVWVGRSGWADRSIFRALDLSPTLWLDRHRMVPGDKRGVWVPGPSWDAVVARFKSEHPRTWGEIEAGFDQWATKAKLPRIVGDRSSTRRSAPSPASPASRRTPTTRPPSAWRRWCRISPGIAPMQSHARGRATSSPR